MTQFRAFAFLALGLAAAGCPGPSKTAPQPSGSAAVTAAPSVETAAPSASSAPAPSASAPDKKPEMKYFLQADGTCTGYATFQCPPEATGTCEPAKPRAMPCPTDGTPVDLFELPKPTKTMKGTFAKQANGSCLFTADPKCAKKDCPWDKPAYVQCPPDAK